MDLPSQKNSSRKFVMRYSDNANNINYHGWFIRSVIVNDLFGRRIAKDRYAEHGDIYYGKQASQGGR